jgi:Fur family iron response transcriptional regulator
MNHTQEMRDKIIKHGLRPTQQRVMLAQALFTKGDRHICVETLHREMQIAGEHISLATIYNTLHSFCEHGMLKEIFVDPERVYFDTRMDEHFHYFYEDQGMLVDLETKDYALSLPIAIPEHAELQGIDVIVRLKSKKTVQ